MTNLKVKTKADTIAGRFVFFVFFYFHADRSRRSDMEVTGKERL